jgi:hypothetical protein
MTLQHLPSEFPYILYEENLIFFFINVFFFKAIRGFSVQPERRILLYTVYLDLRPLLCSY